MAVILHIDTSGEDATVMLARNGQVASMHKTTVQRSQAAVLNGMIAAVLAEGKTMLAGLDAIAVCNGPGSYTGLRIALGTAKGLCYVLDKPLLLQSRLELIAKSNLKNPGATVVAVLPARTGEYFAMALSDTGEEIAAPAHFFLEPLRALLNSLPGEIVIAGLPPGHKELINDLNYMTEINENISVEVWAALTLSAYKKTDFDDLRLASPFYLKEVHTTLARHK